MGMYDTINNEQVKIFAICYPILEENSNVVLGANGGNLRYFDKGDEVPYKTLYYNIGENFDIFDMPIFANDEEQTVIHRIRDGKNIGSIPLEYLRNQDICETAFTRHGNRLIDMNIDKVNHYLESIEKKKVARTVSDRLSREYWAAFREFKDGKIAESELEIKRQKLSERSEYEEIHFINKINKEVSEYLKDDFIYEDSSDYQLLGAIVSSMPEYNEIIPLLDRPVVQDHRLNYIAYISKMNEILNKIDINDFFIKYNITDTESVYKNIKRIQKMEAKLRQIEYKKENLNEQYALHDVLDGRYKEAYKKYNVTPYKNFDYSIWNK